MVELHGNKITLRTLERGHGARGYFFTMADAWIGSCMACCVRMNSGTRRTRILKGNHYV